ncbi:MAG: hypothetical protein ACKO96_18960 [Flammeovirgaceae bacterium]
MQLQFRELKHALPHLRSNQFYLVVFQNIKRGDLAVVFANKGNVANTTEEGCYLAKHLVRFKRLDVKLLKFVNHLVCFNETFPNKEKTRILLTLSYDSFAGLCKPDN